MNKVYVYIGGSFAYLRVELGDFVAFIAAGNILLECLIGGAAVARAWTSYFATLCNHKPDDFRIIVSSLAEGYNHLDPIAVVVIIVTCAVAVTSIKGSSRFNYVASIFHILVILLIIIAGLSKANPSNYTPFSPFGTRGIFKASAVLFFAYGGFDGIATMAEETKNPGRDIPIGLVGSMAIITLLYCLLAVTLCLMQPYQDVDQHAPFSLAFEAVGMGWAKYIVAAGALKGMTSVLLVGAVSQGRYLTHIARTHMMPPCLALVNPRSATPINASILLATATAVISFFTDLDILSNLLSISTLFIFMLVALALLVRRYYATGITTYSHRIKLLACLLLILASSVATSVYWAVSDNGGWIGYVVVLPFWFLGNIGLCLFVPQARNPKVWGVPLVPWLPSISIGINIFLVGSIDKASFVRFAVFTVMILIYYIFVGLHASFDIAKESHQSQNQKEIKSDATRLEKDQQPPGVQLIVP